MQLFQFFIICVLLIGCINIAVGTSGYDCNSKQNCSDCIAFSPKCSWCEDIYYNITEKTFYKKCDLVETHQRQKCSKINNPPSKSTIDKAAPLVDETRVSPQEITVKLRPGQPTKVDVKVKTPKNFPIDLYYLMDLSKSMKDDLKQIRDLGTLLSNEMKDVTSNFRLGFGGYVDKPLGPYTKTNPEEIKSLDPNVQQTFGYKNYLPLDDDPKKFGQTINNVAISYNVDVPEGSLEALMQVIVCKGIGWREKKKARRIVIITTDATFHYSGDGLLGGVVIPNDGKCHLVNDTTYDAWDKFDYPSLSQIRSVMIENQIVPIFATTGNNKLYEKVASFFGNGSGAVADALYANSSNVVPLIKEAYRKIAKTVSIKAITSEGIEVKFEAKCGKNDELKQSAFCNNVQIGEEVTFVAEFLALDCRHAGKNKRFKLETPFDDVIVNLELLCECNCSNTDVNSDDCMSRGDLSCGMCFCDKDKYAGRFCQCTAEEARNQTRCKVPGSSKICNDQGRCVCGECVCYTGQLNKYKEIEYIDGNQCQCSNTTCKRSNGSQVCGGPDHGTCICGECDCTQDWQGESCADRCPRGKDNCIDDLGVECSNKGSCKCNQCQCKKGYIGDFCQECATNCPDPCQDYRECVKCRVFDTSDLSSAECEAECLRRNITSHIVVEKVPEDRRRCIARDEDECSFVFTYNKDNVTDTIQLVVQKDRICPAEPDILAIILGVIAGIVGIGLALLLIWKLLATIQDRREFAQFEKDRQNPKWDSGENPIYQKATSTFQNPMYGNKPEEMEPLT